MSVSFSRVRWNVKPGAPGKGGGSDVWCVLICGGRSVIVPDWGMLNGEAMVVNQVLLVS